MPLLLLLLAAEFAQAQSWTQFGQNAQHSGVVGVKGQRPSEQFASFTYDALADQIRADTGGELLVHYMAPLVDDGAVYIMSRGGSSWVSCRSGAIPCGTARWSQMEWGITKLSTYSGGLVPGWTAMSSWKPPPDTGQGWEPVFHPALVGRYLYSPAAAGALMRFDRRTGELLATIQPFGDANPNRYVTSPLTVDATGAILYTAMQLNAADPWGADAEGAWLVKVDAAGHTAAVPFRELVRDAPSDNCVTTFAGAALPWPPAPDAKPPAGPCGSQRPGLNAAPAVAQDGTIYIASRAHLNPAYGYVVAVNPDLTPKWSASLRGRLRDGCGVLVPPSGTVGGCRLGSTPGVDPATNDFPAGTVNDLSTASPAVAPDGSVLYGAFTRYNYARGHLFRFDSAGNYLSAYDFGWDITPAIYRHDGTWSVIVKDNFYPVGSYCSTFGFCGQGEESYSLTSLTPEFQVEWKVANTAEWCVNMVAVDRSGTVFANSEDGNVYAVDRAGTIVGKLFLKLALGAAYTPLAIGVDGRVYTQNDGVLFSTGTAGRVPHLR